ncbi:hypothetical protein JCM11251_000766 [Rhodosporidiobolus azoricus]
MSPPSAHTASSTSGSVAPALPYDVLSQIALEAIGSAVEREERDVACAISLVCHDLRYVGQSALWRKLTLPRPALQGDGAGGAVERLLAMVQHLRWEVGAEEDEGDGFDPLYWAYDGGWSEDEEQDWKRDGDKGGDQARKLEAQHDSDSSCGSEKDFPFFLTVVGRLEALTAVAAIGLSFPDLLLFTTALSSSPSRLFLTSLTITAATPEVSQPYSTPPLWNELDFIVFLQTFPSLSSFSGNLTRLPPPLRLPAISPATSPILPLRHLSLGEKPHELTDDILRPSSPESVFLESLQPYTLKSLTLVRSQNHDGWICWIARPAFSRLTSLTIISGNPPLADFLPLLSQTLAQLPSLRHFQLEDLSTPGPPLPGEVGAVAFRTFLNSIPSYLRKVELIFEASVGIVEDYLSNREPSSLRYVRINTRVWEWVFKLKEEGWDESGRCLV